MTCVNATPVRQHRSTQSSTGDAAGINVVAQQNNFLFMEVMAYFGESENHKSLVPCLEFLCAVEVKL